MQRLFNYFWSPVAERNDNPEEGNTTITTEDLKPNRLLSDNLFMTSIESEPEEIICYLPQDGTNLA